MASRRGVTPGRPVAPASPKRTALPDEPTRVGSFEESADTRAAAVEALAPGVAARAPRSSGYDAQRATEVFQSGRHRSPAPFADSKDDLVPFSESRVQPLYAPADPEVMELLTSDIDLSDLGEQGEPRRRARAKDSAPNKMFDAPTRVAADLAVPGVPAVQVHKRPIRDFDEDLATRVHNASIRDPSLELSLSDAMADPRSVVAARTQGPMVELPPSSEKKKKKKKSGFDEGRQPGRWADDNDKSVVRRIVKSVVAHLPRSVQNAAHNSGIFKLPGVSEADPFAMGTRDARALGLDPRAWREARTAPIFDGLPNDALKEALSDRTLKILRLDRDTIIPVGGGLVLVRSGQVALGQFPADKLEIEREVAEKLVAGNPLIGKKLDKKERRRRAKAGALMRMAEKNLATFEEGDVVEISVGARRHDTLGIYSVTPVTVITIDREVADRWRESFPFMADRLRRAGASARARVEATSGAKAVVADFFIRHGLSVSLTLRVRKLDACIECGACEKACEDRYGAKRLSLNGRILGNLDFVDACHTCTDQRCIDPCNFDAISFDLARKEVLINEANCTGCTLCAVACPYDAIEMHELDDKPKLKLRLEKANALGHGDGAGRKAKLRRIASKCDHCAFYEDQACISACPTGALIEILPSDVVSQMPAQARATAKAGFDRTVRVDVNQLNQVDNFAKKGLSQLPELGRARARRGRLSMGFWWFLGVASFLFTSAEIALRIYRPERSLAFFVFTHADGFDRELALSRVDYRPGCELAVNLGYVGTALMLTGMAYVWRRRMPFMRTVGSLRSWFDWHVLSGVFGPLFILLHSVGRLDNWVSLAFWSMVVTVISGLLGRYLTTQLPQAASTAIVETLEVDRQLGKLRIEHPGVRVADSWFEEARRRLLAFEARYTPIAVRGVKQDASAATVGDGVTAVMYILKDDLTRWMRNSALSKALASSVRGPGARKIRNRTYKLATRLATLERRRVLLPRLEPLFLRWKAIHVPMAIALTVIATIHIFLSLRSS